MATLSVRFRDERTLERLRERAGDQSLSALAERLIDEGLRSDAHPGIVFRDGPTGRRAGLAHGQDVWEVIGTLRYQSGEPEQRVEATAELLTLHVGQVRTALGYYADHAQEIDERIAANVRAADLGLARWEAEQRLLSG